MLSLIRSEWIKLTKRPMTWTLLALFLALMVVQYLQFLLVVSLGAGVLNPAQVDDVRRRLVFPGAFGAVFGHINGLGGVFAAVLAAAFVGGEYSWGTLRTYLPRYPNRARYLLAKIITLLLALLVGMVITLIVGSIAALGFGAIGGVISAPDAAALLALPLAMLRALFVLLPYVLVTVAATVYGRSLIVGLVAGLLFQFVDIAFGAVATFARLGGIWQLVYNLMVQANINTLTYMNNNAFGLRPEALDRSFDPSLLPSPLQATLVVALYSASFLITALLVFRRRDVSGAS